jgi:hypothetical protein
MVSGGTGVYYDDRPRLGTRPNARVGLKWQVTRKRTGPFGPKGNARTGAQDASRKPKDKK